MTMKIIASTLKMVDAMKMVEKTQMEMESQIHGIEMETEKMMPKIQMEMEMQIVSIKIIMEK